MIPSKKISKLQHESMNRSLTRNIVLILLGVGVLQIISMGSKLRFVFTSVDPVDEPQMGGVKLRSNANVPVLSPEYEAVHRAVNETKHERDGNNLKRDAKQKLATSSKNKEVENQAATEQNSSIDKADTEIGTNTTNEERQSIEDSRMNKHLNMTKSSNMKNDEEVTQLSAVSSLDEQGVLEGETNTEGEKINEFTSSFVTNTWPIVQDRFCGNGVPNPKRGRLLARLVFQLAREETFQETFVAEYIERASKHSKEAHLDDTVRSYGNKKSLLRLFYENGWPTTVFKSNGVSGEYPYFQTVYPSIYKCANEQIRSMEEQLFSDKKLFNGTLSQLPIRKALNLFRRQPTNKNKPFIDQPPCIYTAVRDPISHFLSGYNEIEWRLVKEFVDAGIDLPKAPYHYIYPYTTTMSTKNATEASDTNYNTDSDRVHLNRKQRFSAFVIDFLREDDTLTVNAEYSHVFSMSRVLTAIHETNQTLTGYIPTIKNIHKTWPEFIAKTCPGAPPLEKFPKMKRKAPHKSSNDPLGLYQAAKDVWKEGGPIAKALCLMHLIDYACWTDLPDGVPNVCMEVYSKYSHQLLQNS